MARKGRRKFNLRRVRIAHAGTVGALASADVVANAFVDAATDTYRLMSLDASFAWSNKAEIDDGMEFGIAAGDYTAAEIEECLEANGSINSGDRIAREQANRLVRSIGTFGSSGALDNSGVVFADGRKVKTRLNWLVPIGKQPKIWIRNGSGTVYTTGSQILVNGDIWVKDSA